MTNKEITKVENYLKYQGIKFDIKKNTNYNQITYYDYQEETAEINWTKKDKNLELIIIIKGITFIGNSSKNDIDEAINNLEAN